MTRLEKIFFAINVAVWVPYALYCTFNPGLLTVLGVFDQAYWVEQVEVRAMYGGAQLAIGLFALTILLKPGFDAATGLLLYTLLFGGLSLVRLVGLLVDGPGPGFDIGLLGQPDVYNSGALWLFEVPMFIFAALLLYQNSARQKA